MINSVPALCRTLSASLRRDVLPHIDDAFARSQLSAAIYVLNNLERQAGWSNPRVAGQAARADEAIAAVRSSALGLGIELPCIAPSTGLDASTDEARRDAADAQICAWFDWFADTRKNGTQTPELRQLEAKLLEQAMQSVAEDRHLVAPSMMREMSGAAD